MFSIKLTSYILAILLISSALFFLSILFFTPQDVYAQQPGDFEIGHGVQGVFSPPYGVLPKTPTTFSELVTLFLYYINQIVLILISLAILGFLWGLSQYILSAKDGSKIEEGSWYMGSLGFL